MATMREAFEQMLDQNRFSSDEAPVVLVHIDRDGRCWRYAVMPDGMTFYNELEFYNA